MAVLDNSMAGAMDAPDSPVAATRNVEVAAAWSPVRRVVFRLGFSYLALYLFTSYLQLLDVIPHGAAVTAWYENLWAALVPWIGKHLFHVDAPQRFTGSGDAMFNWLQVLFMLAVSLVAALLWTLLDRRRTPSTRG